MSEEEKNDVLKEMKLKSISAIRADHIANSFCVAVVTQDDYKIVYSGDTRPLQALIDLGKKDQKTNLLIHEATLGTPFLNDCIMKKHTTFTEAVKVSEEMEADYSIFTHFSQRYARIPTFEEFEVDAAKNCGIAFDHMVITPKNLCTIQTIYPALKIMFQRELQYIEKQSLEKSQNFQIE